MVLQISENEWMSQLHSPSPSTEPQLWLALLQPGSDYIDPESTIELAHTFFEASFGRAVTADCKTQ